MLQLPLFLGLVTSLLLWRSEMLDHFLVLQLSTIFTLGLRWFYGEADFDEFETTGPYAVGFTEFNTEEYSNGVSIFYPVDKATTKKHEDVQYQRYGDRQWQGLLKISEYRRHPVGTWMFLLPYKLLRLPIRLRATCAKNFAEGKDKL